MSHSSARPEDQPMGFPGATSPVANSVGAMTNADDQSASVPPVNETLAWVVLLMRLLGWIWMVALSLTALSDTDHQPDVPTILWILAIATASVALMILAIRFGFLGSLWYVALDGIVAVVALSGALLAGSNEFVGGGVPMSWLFLVAYASTLRGTILASLALTALFAWLHVLMGLPPTRVVGSVQFVVVGLIVSWAFDSLRQRERLRLEAESERAVAEEALAVERGVAARLEERSRIATRLHDSVLQTLKLIMSNAGDPSEVRYLARVQERELRKTINEYRSPYEDGFRARLLDARASIEDQYRVEIEQVIVGDTAMTPALSTLVAATREAMANAALHSGSSSIDLFGEVRPHGVQVNVRDRGTGFHFDEAAGGGVVHSLIEPVRQVGGEVTVKTSPGAGTDIGLWVPLP